MIKSKPTVLVTACGCPGGPSVVRALKDDFFVVGTDNDPAASGSFWADAFYQVPRGDDPAFVPAILDLCQREQAAVVLPESSDEVLSLARAKAQFDRLGGLHLLVSEPEAVELALDKARTYAALKGVGVPLPEYVLIDESLPGPEAWNLITKALYALGYPDRPVVLKRPVAKGGRGFWVVQASVVRPDLDMRQWPNAQRITLPELASWAAKRLAGERGLGRWLVMEHLEDEGTGANTFDCFGPVLGYTKYRYDCRNSVHWRHVARYDAELMDWGRRVVARLGLDYFVNVQFMGGKLLEVNPRISTQILAPGFNLPALGVKLALGLIDRADVHLPDGARAQYFLDQRATSKFVAAIW